MASITIKLEVYLPFRGHRIWRGDEEIVAGLTAGDLPASVGLSAPELAVLVGGRNVAEDTPLQEGDEVAILRQAEGGSGSDLDSGQILQWPNERRDI